MQQDGVCKNTASKNIKKLPPSQAIWQLGQQGFLGYSAGQSVTKLEPGFVTGKNTKRNETLEQNADL